MIDASSGGGVINVQANFLAVSNSGLISNGIGGIQGGGGGSGGSISIDFSTLSTSGNITISANGGEGKSSGAGGRIRFFYHNWTQQALKTEMSWSQPFKIEVLGGRSCQGSLTCGEIGSIVAAPCPPGSSLNLTTFACESCPTGFFQIDYGYETCQPCASQPANSVYNTFDSFTKLSNYSSVCNFTCQAGTIPLI